MNNLNSVIIEGSVSDLKLEKLNAAFNVNASRSVKVNGKMKTEISKIPVMAYGTVAMRIVHVSETDEVRIVGRLQEYDGFISVLAEHIEIIKKPVETIKKNENPKF